VECSNVGKGDIGTIVHVAAPETGAVLSKFVVDAEQTLAKVVRREENCREPDLENQVGTPMYWLI
jgi:hypothetical protein